MQTLIRIGEKNNFNQTSAEFDKLKSFDGYKFTNSNSFTTISAELPSFVTINPYLRFVEPKGSLENVKAFRIKLFIGSKEYMADQIEALKFAKKTGIPILITFMRFRSKKTKIKFDVIDTGYVWDHNYYRPTKNTQKKLIKLAKKYNNKVNICDENGTGCLDCQNCNKLTYNLTGDYQIKALNLSISGIKDKNGRLGLCPFNCPDCFAKIVTYGKRPACDKLITNAKILGNVNHV